MRNRFGLSFASDQRPVLMRNGGGKLKRREPSISREAAILGLTLCTAAPVYVWGQQPPIASVPTQGAILHGAMSVVKGHAAIANNGEIAAEDKTVPVALTRGGTLDICASTAVRIARDAAPQPSVQGDDTGLMFSLDRGALEAHYRPGAYSDVVLTPDLRILISPPGVADLKLRVNEQGDTCIDNAGKNAPYVTASSLMDGGIYRVRPGQRVLFVHGSLNEVVDNESESCGCPAAAPAADDATNAGHAGGPSSTPTDTAFPTAVSEGLQPPPQLDRAPVVPEGQVHAEVAATLSSSTPPEPPPSPPPPDTQSAVTPPPVVAAAKHPRKRGFFHAVGHFFARVFGADD